MLLSPFDNVFVAVESDENLMNIGGLYYLPPVNPILIKRHIDNFIHSNEKESRMKSKISTTRTIFNQPRWIVDYSYSIDNHFETVELKDGNCKQDLADVVGTAFAKRFDMNDKPLWNATFITNIGDRETSRSALFIQCHHALGDGQAFVRSLLKFVSTISNGKLSEEELAKLQYSAGRNAKKTTKPPSLVSSIQHIFIQIFMFLYGMAHSF